MNAYLISVVILTAMSFVAVWSVSGSLDQRRNSVLAAILFSLWAIIALLMQIVSLLGGWQ